MVFYLSKARDLLAPITCNIIAASEEDGNGNFCHRRYLGPLPGGQLNEECFLELAKGPEGLQSLSAKATLTNPSTKVTSSSTNVANSI